MSGDGVFLRLRLMSMDLKLLEKGLSNILKGFTRTNETDKTLPFEKNVLSMKQNVIVVML